jgi:hypothetical protein
MPPCAICPEITCDFPSDLELYSHDGFLNGQLYPVIFCPPGYNCTPAINGFIYFQCCTQTLSRAVTAGMDYAHIQPLIQSMLTECLGYGCSDASGGGGGGGSGGGGPSILTLRRTVYFNSPQSVSGTCPSGSTFVYTMPAGVFAGTSFDDANKKALALAQRIFESMNACITPPRLGGSPGWGCLGADTAFTPELNIYRITGSNSAANYTWSIVDGALPAGLTLVDMGHDYSVYPPQAIAQLDGIPTVPGVYNYTVQAARVGFSGVVTQVADVFSVFGITNDILPNATVGSPYLDSGNSVQLLTAGGKAPVTFAVAPTDLPGWMTLNTDGTITGTPTATDAGIFGFSVVMTDAEGGSCTQTVTITVTGVVGPDWTQLSWTTQVNFFENGASTILTPNNTTGTSFHHQCSTPGWTVYGPEAGATTSSLFTVPTTGGGCHCNLHLTYTLTGIFQAAHLSVQMNIPGQASIFWLVPANAAGTYDIPFTLNVAGNVTGQVSLQITESGYFPFTPTTAFTIDLQGTFSNVP